MYVPVCVRPCRKLRLLDFSCSGHLLQNGATYNYFKTSKQAADARIFQTVVADPSSLVRSNAEGLHRVKNGNGAYAFIGESLGLGECDII